MNKKKRKIGAGPPLINKLGISACNDVLSLFIDPLFFRLFFADLSTIKLRGQRVRLPDDHPDGQVDGQEFPSQTPPVLTIDPVSENNTRKLIHRLLLFRKRSIEPYEVYINQP